MRAHPHTLIVGGEHEAPTRRLGGCAPPASPAPCVSGGTISDPRPDPRAPRLCFVRRCAKCGETDHYLNECSKNTCFKCGVKGHIATNCPGRPEGVGRGGMGGLAGAGSLVPPQGVPPPPPEHPPRYLGFDDSGSFREASADWTGHKRQLNGM